MTRSISFLNRLKLRTAPVYSPVSEKTKEIIDRIAFIIKKGHAIGPVDAAKWYYNRLKDGGHDLLPVEKEEYSEFVTAIVVFLIQKETGRSFDTNSQKRVQYLVISELKCIHEKQIML